MKKVNGLMLAILTAAGMAFGAGMQLEWDMPLDLWYITFPYLDNSQTDNYTLFDLENDGVIEIIANHSNTGMPPLWDSIKIYDGATHQLKHTIFLDSIALESQSFCFIDIDGDGKKELFASKLYGGAIFIDIENKIIKYEIINWQLSRYHAFFDIDKDNYPELLTNSIDSAYMQHFQVWGYNSAAVKPSPAGVYKTAAAKLFPNVPNPFRTSATIEYFIPSEGSVLLTIFNAEGRLVRTLVNEPKKKGSYSAIWNGETDSGAQLSSGAYFYRLTLGSKIAVSRQMVFLK
jgi:hypothetical protein